VNLDSQYAFLNQRPEHVVEHVAQFGCASQGADFSHKNRDSWVCSFTGLYDGSLVLYRAIPWAAETHAGLVLGGHNGSHAMDATEALVGGMFFFNHDVAVNGHMQLVGVVAALPANGALSRVVAVMASKAFHGHTSIHYKGGLSALFWS
jgi:hypothetical protein